MSIATLNDIINKVRRLTGSGSSLQLTDAQIIDYINSFYLYDLPAQFRSLKLKDRYTFNTIRGIDVYPFDSEHYTTVNMPCYCAKREIKLFTDPWSFFGVNFNWQTQENFATGSAALGSGPYTGTAQSTPIIRSVWNNPMVQSPTTPTSSYYPNPSLTNPDFTNSVIPSRVQNILITANSSLGVTQNVTDDGAGNLIGDGTGSINYDTGAISVTFNNNVPTGESISIQYNPATLSIPLSILFFQNQFTLRPVPDKGYTIELVAYRQPSQALLGSADPENIVSAGIPELREWWELLAAGASKKVYEDRLDSDGVSLMDKMLKERYDVAMSRTYAQIGQQRINTLFADQLQYNYGSNGWGFGSGQ